MELEIGRRVRFTDTVENQDLGIVGRLGRYVSKGKQNGVDVFDFNVPGVGMITYESWAIEKCIDTSEGATVCRFELKEVDTVACGTGDRIYCDACGEPLPLGTTYCYNEVTAFTTCAACIEDAGKLFKLDEKNARLGAGHALACIRKRMQSGGMINLEALVRALEDYFEVTPKLRGAGEKRIIPGGEELT